MESQRFLQPVFREFYKERDVVAEEYRMRVESNPQGKLLQHLLRPPLKLTRTATLRAGGRATSPTCGVRGEGVFRHLLCAVEHGDRDCGRRESGGGPADGGAVLRPDAARSPCPR